MKLSLPKEEIVNFIKKPEGFFVVASLFFGVVFLILVPPFKTPDESIHIYRAYEVSELKLPHVNKNGETGSMLPASIRKTEIATKGYFKLGQKYDPKYDYRYTKHALVDIPLNKNEQMFYATSGSPAYNPVSYIPQAAVAGVSSAVGAPVIATVYAIRFTNLLLWIALGFIGIRIFPWKKWAVVGIALLPSVVFQSISPGLDVGVFGSTLIFLAIILRAVEDKKKLQLRDIIALIGTSSFMVVGKFVGIAFLPLVWLIRNSQLSKNSLASIAIKLLITFLPILIFAGWAVASMRFASAPVVADSGVSAVGVQVSTLLHDPFKFAVMLMSTIFTDNAFSKMIETSIIGNFGFLTEPMSPLFITFGYVFLAGLFFINIKGEQIKHITQKLRVSVAVAGLAFVVGVFLSMYVFFTLPESLKIRGVNGRYFVPLLFTLIPFLYLNRLELKKCDYIKMVIAGVNVLFIAAVVTLIYYHYG